MSVKADSKTIYIDASNVNDPYEDGSAEHPFDSIQEGVVAARSGDTILVASGVYYESVQIQKSSISLVGEKDNTIIDGNGTGFGIRVFQFSPAYTEYVSITGFIIRNGVKGITLSRSRYIHLKDNSMIGNMYNFGDYTLQIHDIDTSNTVDGKPIYYWVNQHDKRVPADAGYVALVDSTNIIVKDLNLTNNVQGLLLKNTTGSFIENVYVLNNWDGICLDRWSNNNTIICNTVSNNLFLGIYLSTSSGNLVANNTVLNNEYGLFFDSRVFILVEDNEKGLLDSNIVRDNIVRDNTVSNNNFGVYLIESEDNVFYHNNFVNNTYQVRSVDSTNKWDCGGEGNYWSDYKGEDLNDDGIGNTAYVIDENNQDNNPLMGLLSDFCVTWQEETYHVSTISNFTVSDFCFSQPDKMISFNASSLDGTSGFCRVTIPNILLDGPYTLVLDGLPPVNLIERSNGTHCFLYFTYDHNIRSVKIKGTSVISEFSSLLLIFFFVALIVGVTLVALTKRKRFMGKPVLISQKFATSLMVDQRAWFLKSLI